MGCDGKGKTVRAMRSIFTDGSDASGNIMVPIHTGLTSEVSGVRVAMMMEGASPYLRLKAAISYSDDGDAWDTPTTFGNTVSTAYVWGYASTFQTVDNTKRWFRVGVRGSNDTGQSANVEMGTVSVEIDLQAR